MNNLATIKKFKNFIVSRKKNHDECNVNFFLNNEELLISDFNKKNEDKIFIKDKKEILETLTFTDIYYIIKTNPKFLYLKKFFCNKYYLFTSIYKTIRPKQKIQYSSNLDLSGGKILLSQRIILPYGLTRQNDHYANFIQKPNNKNFFGEDIVETSLDTNYENIYKILNIINLNFHKNYELKTDRIEKLIIEYKDLTIDIIKKACHNTNNNTIQIFNEKSLMIAYMLYKVKKILKHNSFCSFHDQEDFFYINISSKFSDQGRPLYAIMNGTKYDNIFLKKIFEDYNIIISINEDSKKINIDFMGDFFSLDLNDNNINRVPFFILEYIKNICKNRDAEKKFIDYYNSIINIIKESDKSNQKYDFIIPSFKKITYQKIIKQEYPLIIKCDNTIFYNKNICFKNIKDKIQHINRDIEKTFLFLNLNINISKNITNKRI